MQLSLVQFGAVSAREPVATGGGMPGHDDAPEPIEISLSEDSGQEERHGLLFGAAKFLMLSITGCSPKRR